MWYVVPAGKGWVEIRESRVRPKLKVYQLSVGERPQSLKVYEGGRCRAVVRTLHFAGCTGRSCERVKQIPAAEAEQFVVADKKVESRGVKD